MEELLKITVEVMLGKDNVIQKKYINMLPSKESYMLPINKTVFDELNDTIQNNGYESDMNIRLTYYHNVSRKKQEVVLKVILIVLILMNIKRYMNYNLYNFYSYNLFPIRKLGYLTIKRRGTLNKLYKLAYLIR